MSSRAMAITNLVALFLYLVVSLVLQEISRSSSPVSYNRKATDTTHK